MDGGLREVDSVPHARRARRPRMRTSIIAGMSSDAAAVRETARKSHPRRLRKYIALGVLLLISSGVYFSCFHQYHLSYQNEGWDFQFAFQPFRCIHCTGVIERLEYNGAPIQLPATHPNPGNECWVYTPVGSFIWYADDNWLAISGPGSRSFERSVDEIDPADLERGYYDVDWDSLSGDEHESGKQGTPSHWCLFAFDHGIRWADPTRLGEIDSWPDPKAEINPSLESPSSRPSP